jgi:hypothetical protein
MIRGEPKPVSDRLPGSGTGNFDNRRRFQLNKSKNLVLVVFEGSYIGIRADGK